MEIVLNKQQRVFLEKIKKHSETHPNYEGPWSRIDNILKAGVYYDNKNSYHTPAAIDGATDKISLNAAAQKYKELKSK